MATERRPRGLSDGVVLPSAATVWTAGFSVPDLAARSGLRTDPLRAARSGTLNPAVHTVAALE
ncbi:hypothetical protein MAHJHV50_49310 [Mycobacterium avium subsp. hominissuis]